MSKIVQYYLSRKMAINSVYGMHHHNPLLIKSTLSFNFKTGDQTLQEVSPVNERRTGDSRYSAKALIDRREISEIRDDTTLFDDFTMINADVDYDADDMMSQYSERLTRPVNYGVGYAQYGGFYNLDIEDLKDDNNTTSLRELCFEKVRSIDGHCEYFDEWRDYFEDSYFNRNFE